MEYTLTFKWSGTPKQLEYLKRHRKFPFQLLLPVDEDDTGCHCLGDMELQRISRNHKPDKESF